MLQRDATRMGAEPRSPGRDLIVAVKTRFNPLTHVTALFVLVEPRTCTTIA